MINISLKKRERERESEREGEREKGEREKGERQRERGERKRREKKEIEKGNFALILVHFGMKKSSKFKNQLFFQGNGPYKAISKLFRGSKRLLIFVTNHKVREGNKICKSR